MTRLTIAYAPDDKYMNMTIVSMISAIENNKDSEIEFLILYSSLSDESIQKLENLKNKYNIQLRMIKMDESEFKDLPLSKWVTVQAWFRIRIPDLCPDLQKVLYLDCDTMINGDLSELFELDLADNYVASVKDVWDVAKHVKRLDMKSESYFNSGMLLINCEKFRQDNIFDQIKEYSIKYKKIIKFCDQDTLNKIIDTKKIDLSPKYNFMDTWWRNYYIEYDGQELVEYNNAKQNPIIVHLTGPKPDTKGCKNIMTDKWWSYAKMSDVYGEICEKYENSKEVKPKKKLLSQIFNMKNEYRYKDKWKVLTFMGVKIKVRKERAEKVFVIFNTAFIGDVLLNSTLVQNIKLFYPESKVVYVVQPQFVDIAKYQRGVDDVIPFNKLKDSNPIGMFKFVKNFPYKNIFASFVLYSNDRNLIFSRVLKAKHIMTEPKGIQTKLCATKEKYKRNTYIHKKDIATGLLESLTGGVKLDIPLAYDAPNVDVSHLLDSDSRYVGLVTTSKFKPKDMPADTAKNLIDRINQSGKKAVMLGAGAVAREYIQELNNIGCNEFIDLTDKTSFIELANVLQRLDCLISVDTGTMHFANAVNTPTVNIFYSTGSEQWAPDEKLYKTITLGKTATDDEIMSAVERFSNN